MTDDPQKILLRAAELEQCLDQLAQQIHAKHHGEAPLAVVGIRSRGEVLAQRLADRLRNLEHRDIQLGSLDITLYRDDLAERGPQAILRKTEIDFDLNGLHLILVDDVLHTGRSVRSALDALVDLGRPKAIRLAVLVDRPGRELPIQADYIGIRVDEQDVPITVQLTESDGIDEVRVG
jgi:pyrimidine operon attenuation protein / uracil phosphoribosyltransferase